MKNENEQIHLFFNQIKIVNHYNVLLTLEFQMRNFLTQTTSLEIRPRSMQAVARQRLTFKMK